MRLTSSMSQVEVRTALSEAVRQTWPGEHPPTMDSVLSQAAKAIWTVLQEPLAPLSEEPDLPSVIDQAALAR